MRCRYAVRLRTYSGSTMPPMLKPSPYRRVRLLTSRLCAQSMSSAPHMSAPNDDGVVAGYERHRTCRSCAQLSRVKFATRANAKRLLLRVANVVYGTEAGTRRYGVVYASRTSSAARHIIRVPHQRRVALLLRQRSSRRVQDRRALRMPPPSARCDARATQATSQKGSAVNARLRVNR